MGLSNGSLSYNVKVLETQNRLKVHRANNNKITRFYPIEFDDNNEFTCSVVDEINHQTSKKIIITLLVAFKGHCILKQLSMLVNRSPSTVYWHLKRMLAKQIVSVIEDKQNHIKLYSLCDKKR
jgi:predicted transcriptional regulator